MPFDVLFPNAYLLPAPGLPAFGLGLPRPRAAPAGSGTAPSMRSGRQWDKGLSRLNAPRASLGLDPIDVFFDQMHRARRILVMTSPDFDFSAEQATCATSAPCSTIPPGRPASRGPPRGRAPLVLVALSSTFQDHAGSLQRIVDGLGSLPVRAIVTTGPALDPTDIVPLHPGQIGRVAIVSAPHSSHPSSTPRSS